MDAFDQNGHVKWSVSGFYPVMATADGGLIAQSSAGQYLAFDQNGAATGMLAEMPTYSWIGNWYSTSGGPLMLTALPPVYLADSYLASFSGNPSETPTAVEQPWYAPLPSCPGAQTPCAKEAIENALASLRSLLSVPCQACQTYVFQKLGGNQQNLYQFLNRTPRFYDGSRSQAPLRTLCGNTEGVGGWLKWAWCAVNEQNVTISAKMASMQADAVSQTPSDSGTGMMVFFNPAAMCKSLGSTPGALLNQALLFHESLHGYYGAQDPFLLSYLGMDSSDPSEEITFYLNLNIFGSGVRTCGD